MLESKKVRKHRFVLIMLWILSAVCPAYCSTYFVDPNGNDTTGNGSIGSPWKTIPKAVTAAAAGDTIYLRGGTHGYTSTVTLSPSGSSGNYITMQAYGDEAVIVDFTGQAYGSSSRGISVSGDYWHLKKFTIQYAGDNGLYIPGSYNIAEQIVSRMNSDSGIQLHEEGSYNLVLNCDSYLNYDAPNSGENADGFAVKSDTIGPGNIFRGCRSWHNADDGFDLYYSQTAIRFEDCWAFDNGVNRWGASSWNGDGNGYKLGDSAGNHALIRCVAYDHPHNGIDINGDTLPVEVYNCTTVNNAGKNFYFDEAGVVSVLRNNISYGNSVYILTEVDDQYNSWNGFTVTSADFVSLDSNGIDGPRQSDGSLPELSFLHLASSSSMIDAGIDVGEPYNGSAPDLGRYETGDSNSPPGAASNPTPSTDATNVSLTQDLSWTAGSNTDSHDVYFGTTNPPSYIGEQTGTTYDTGTMSNNTTYYWRIDENNANGTTTGTVWSFTTVPPAPAAASNPTPANGATGVSTTQDLSWTAGSGATSRDVYFGTAATPPLVSSSQTATTYDTGTMGGGTTYYWRIDEKNAGGTTTGTVWNFTTLADTTAPTPDPMTWATVPTATGSTTITMTAATATDTSGVEYYFDCLTTGGHDSSWQTSTAYQDTGLSPSTQYTYRVKARDKSSNNNETGWSTEQSATTQATPTDVNIIGSWASGTTHAKESGTNRVLIFIAHGELSSGTMNLSAVTYGGQSMTKVMEYNYNAASGYAYAAAFILKEAGVAAATTSTFTPTWSGTQPTSSGYSSAFFSNVDQTTSIGATGTGGGTTNPVTTSSALSTSNGDMVILGATCGNVGSYTLNNSFIEGTDQQMSSATGVTGRKHATGATETPSATYSSTINRQMIIGFVLKAAASVSPPGTATNPTPANGAINVSLTQDLSWTAGSGATSHDVYFGTSSPGTFQGNQTAATFDTGTMASTTTYYWRIDEKNAGGTTTGTVWSFTTQDTVSPTPNPMTWSIEPNAISSSSITMTATTATDISGVEYYFANITDPNHDSNWVANPSWTDTELANDTTYAYKVKARDTSTNHNETGWSSEAADTTRTWDCTAAIASDIDGDCQVNLFDFVHLADAWAGNPPSVDLTGDEVLDWLDIQKFAEEWLSCNRNPAEECWQ